MSKSKKLAVLKTSTESVKFGRMISKFLSAIVTYEGVEYKIQHQKAEAKRFVEGGDREYWTPAVKEAWLVRLKHGTDFEIESHRNEVGQVALKNKKLIAFVAKEVA